MIGPLFGWKPPVPNKCNALRGRCREPAAPKTHRTGPTPTRCVKHVAQQKAWRDKYSAKFNRYGVRVVK